MYRAACADCDPCVALWLRCVAKSPAPSWNRRRVCRRSRPDRTAQRTCRATRAGCVSKLGRAVQRAPGTAHRRETMETRALYTKPLYKFSYIHTCRVKISTFPWRPVSISARSSRLLLRLRLWDCADCGPRTCHSSRLLRAQLRRDVQLGFRCRLRRRRPRLGFRPARADGMWATGPSSHICFMLKN